MCALLEAAKVWVTPCERQVAKDGEYFLQRRLERLKGSLLEWQTDRGQVDVLGFGIWRYDSDDQG